MKGLCQICYSSNVDVRVIRGRITCEKCMDWDEIEKEKINK
jgi:hypothetical protein